MMQLRAGKQVLKERIKDKEQIFNISDLNKQITKEKFISSMVNSFNSFYQSFLVLSEQNIDILSMVGRNYPEVFYNNWEVLRPFLEQAFQ